MFLQEQLWKCIFFLREQFWKHLFEKFVFRESNLKKVLFKRDILKMHFENVFFEKRRLKKVLWKNVFFWGSNF